jgi:hypothetical protein
MQQFTEPAVDLGIREPNLKLSKYINSGLSLTYELLSAPSSLAVSGCEQFLVGWSLSHILSYLRRSGCPVRLLAWPGTDGQGSQHPRLFLE